jgi:hypothetical protein
MKLDGRYIEDRLRLAEQEEIANSDGHIFGDLREHLTADSIENKGVGIEFGESAVFKSVVDALGIFELLHKQPDSLHIHALHLSKGIDVARLGRLIPKIGELPFLSALNLLQSSEWKTHGSYPAIQPQTEAMSSKIIIANSKRTKDGTLQADLGAIGVLVGMYNRYLPDFDDAELSLPYILQTLEGRHGVGSRETTGALIDFTVMEGIDLVMPQTSYYLSLGKFGAEYGLFEPTDNVRVQQHLIAIDGRIIIKPEESETPDDTEVPLDAEGYAVLPAEDDLGEDWYMTDDDEENY